MRTTVVVIFLLFALIGSVAYLTKDQWTTEPTLTVSDQLPTYSTETSPVKVKQTATPTVVVGALDDETLDTNLKSQAIGYIGRLTEAGSDPVPVEKADHFIRSDQVLSLLPDEAVRVISPEQLLAFPDLDPDQPITLVKEIEQVETLTAEKLIAAGGGDLEVKITLLDDDGPREITIREALTLTARNPDALISIVKKVRFYEITTPREMRNDDDPNGTTIGIINKPYRLEAATIGELMSLQADVNQEDFFYVRTVQSSDTQGIWGIVQHGLVENFARGMTIRRGEQIDTYQVVIPTEADELQTDFTSSFLGRMIFEKTSESYVYNYLKQRMGRNPDTIYPGQEIVIIPFSADELINIYSHFVSQ